jgi:signal peptidase I
MSLEQNATPPDISQEETTETKRDRPTFQESLRAQFFEFFRFILTALVIIIPIRVFIAQPFIVSGSSMVPTFMDKDYLIVDQISYRLSDPQRNDVIVMRYPIDPSQFFIKRIVGLPGETITLQSGKVYVKELDSSEALLLDESYLTHTTANDNLTVTLASDEFFVLGDNRPASSDSRTWGVLPEDKIVGKPFVRLFPANELTLHPGNFEIPLTENKLTN